jgi:arylsulfatase A-like enzyme
VAARRGRWKLVLGAKAAAPVELFDLDADRGETTDVAAAHPDRVAELRAAIAALAAELGDGAPGPGVRAASTLPK